MPCLAYPHTHGALAVATRRLLCALAVTALVGCGVDPSVERFENYRERLARSLKQDNLAARELAIPERPSKRALQLTTSEQSIGLLDFLKLYDCSVWQVIGERNSALGKVAPASQTLFTELDFLRLAPQCSRTLRARGADALAKKLADAIDVKRRELAIRIWQATLGSDEFDALWHVPLALGDFQPASDLPVEDALHTLSRASERWLGGDYQYDAETIETALGRIRHGSAGHWLRAAALTQSQLDAASQIAAGRLQRRPLCFRGQANQQAAIFRNVVQQFFVGDIQVWAAEYNRVLYQVLGAHKALEASLLAVQPDSYRAWAAQRDTLLDNMNEAAREHVAALAPLLRSCGLLPGQ